MFFHLSTQNDKNTKFKLCQSQRMAFAGKLYCQTCLLETGDTFHDQIVSCQCTGLVKAADIYLPSKRDPEWLCAVHI